jgi:hypothetical protein
VSTASRLVPADVDRLAAAADRMRVASVPATAEAPDPGAATSMQAQLWDARSRP